MKAILKALTNAIALVLVLPAVASYLCGRSLLGAEKAFPGWSEALSLIPGLTGVYLRRAFYKTVLSRCGTDSFLGFGTIFSHATAEVGDRVYVGPGCCLGDVTLEADVLLGSHVSIMNGSGQHGIDRFDIPIREQPGVWPRITVGPNTWIGDRAVIMADVGRHCVIGAAAVVTKPIPDYAIAFGSPARIIRYRNEKQPIAEAGKEPSLLLGTCKGAEL